MRPFKQLFCLNVVAALGIRQKLVWVPNKGGVRVDVGNREKRWLTHALKWALESVLWMCLGTSSTSSTTHCHQAKTARYHWGAGPWVHCVAAEPWKSERVGKMEMQGNVMRKGILVSGVIQACPLWVNKSLAICGKLRRAEFQDWEANKQRRSLLSSCGPENGNVIPILESHSLSMLQVQPLWCRFLTLPHCACTAGS